MKVRIRTDVPECLDKVGMQYEMNEKLTITRQNQFLALEEYIVHDLDEVIDGRDRGQNDEIRKIDELDSDDRNMRRSDEIVDDLDS